MCIVSYLKKNNKNKTNWLQCKKTLTKAFRLLFLLSKVDLCTLGGKGGGGDMGAFSDFTTAA